MVEAIEDRVTYILPLDIYVIFEGGVMNHLLFGI